MSGIFRNITNTGTRFKFKPEYVSSKASTFTEGNIPHASKLRLDGRYVGICYELSTIASAPFAKGRSNHQTAADSAESVPRPFFQHYKIEDSYYLI